MERRTHLDMTSLWSTLNESSYSLRHRVPFQEDCECAELSLLDSWLRPS